MDNTEAKRRLMVTEINSNSSSREELEAKYGQVWDTTELTRDFKVDSFLAPFVYVIRKTDEQPFVLAFQHSPRFYWKA